MDKTMTMFSGVRAFRMMCIISLTMGLLTVIFAVVAYLPVNPEFSIFNTYLSDIGDTPGWPQIIFNNGTILAAPLRVMVIGLMMLVLRGYAGRRPGFEGAVMALSLVSTIGTVCMTAVPYSSGPAVHKVGIGLYFLGAVILQSVLGTAEWRVKAFPRYLPMLSFFIVFCFLVFLVFFMLLQTGADVRALSIFWEWMCFFSSMLWLVGHFLFSRGNAIK